MKVWENLKKLWTKANISHYYINCSGIASGSKLKNGITRVDKNDIHTCVMPFLTNQCAGVAMFQYSMSQSLPMLSRNIFGSFSAIFGKLSSEMFGKVQRMFGIIHTTFGQHFENLRKLFKTSVISRFIFLFFLLLLFFCNKKLYWC